MTNFLVRWQKEGAHVKVRLFCATYAQSTPALSGSLTLREEEWESFLRCFDGKGRDSVVIVPEDGDLIR